MQIPSIKAYLIGFVLCLLLTFASYFFVAGTVLTGLSLWIAISLFALIQGWIQFYIFLGLGAELAINWRLTLFLFMVLITLLLVGGSLWIMIHLNYNLMINP